MLSDFVLVELKLYNMKRNKEDESIFMKFSIKQETILYIK